MSQPIKAISKEEALQKVKERVFPDYIMQAFNECIVEAKIKKSDNVLKDDVINRILELNPEMKRQTLIDEHLLDVEDAYRQAGWKVEYCNPSRGENFGAYFSFR